MNETGMPTSVQIPDPYASWIVNAKSRKLKELAAFFAR